MNKRKVILRADGNRQIGMGHVYRLLALAEILSEDFEPTFIINNPDSFILEEINGKCAHCITLNYEHQYRKPDEVKTGEELHFDMKGLLAGDEIIVTDGYLFGPDYQSAIKASGASLVCIDDLAMTEFYADLVINHAPGMDAARYMAQPYTKILCGLDYAIIRKPFFKPLKEDMPGQVGKAFISLGGADFYGYTEKLLGLLQPLEEFGRLHVLCSSSFDAPLLDSLRHMQDESEAVLLHFNLRAEEIVAVLDDCTHAFVSASTVLMESYSRGLRCFAGYYTNNQLNMHAGYTRLKLAGDIGHFSELNPQSIAATLAGQANIKPLSTAFTSDLNIREAFQALN